MISGSHWKSENLRDKNKNEKGRARRKKKEERKDGRTEEIRNVQIKKCGEKIWLLVWSSIHDVFLQCAKSVTDAIETDVSRNAGYEIKLSKPSLVRTEAVQCSSLLFYVQLLSVPNYCRDSGGNLIRHQVHVQ